VSGPAPDREEAQALPLRELARRVGGLEGWDPQGQPPPPVPTRWQDLRVAAGTALWWPIAPLVGLGLLADGVATPWRVALAAGAGVLVLWAFARTVGVLVEIRSAHTGPVGSEWAYQVVRDVEDTWFVLLLLGDTAHWAAPLVGPAHPALSGRCSVRGDLRDGHAVHLLIGADTWVPAGPVLRVDDEFREEIRTDLVERLLPDEDAGRPVGPPAERGPEEPIQ
jgi:hypothetical protein